MNVPALALVMTTAGLIRFTAAQANEDIDLTIAQVGLSAQSFVAAPSLTAVPGEFRRLDAVSGAQVGDNIVHMIVRDEGAASYQVRGFGLFLADGTLFAAYAQPGPILEKSSASTTLFAIDIAFPAGTVAQIVFGNTNFLNPPATTTSKGVVELATIAEARAGEDPARVPSVAGVQAMLRGFMPIGTILLWSGAAATVPDGWAICDGRTIQRSDGAGEITTPDLRDRVPVGAGGEQAIGALFGAGSSTLDTGDAGAHTHAATIEQAPTGMTIEAPVSNQTAGGGTGKSVTSVALDDPGHTHEATLAEVGSHHHALTIDLHQPSIALFFIMRI